MKKQKSVIELIVVFALIYVGILAMENDYLLRSAVKDDLNFTSYFCNASLFEVIYAGGYKFRPVSSTILWILAHICGENLYLYGYVNILFGAICALVIYYFAKDVFGSELYGAIATVLYVVSRFSYYQITTQLGVMETTSTLLGIVFVWKLYKYLDIGKSKYFYSAVVFYFLCSMSHERYTALMPILIYVWLMSDEKSKFDKKSVLYFKKPLITLGVFVGILAIFQLLVTNMMVGTGGTVVTETISVESVYNNVIKSIKYIFGINTSEIWLTMIDWNSYSEKAKFTIIASIIMIVIIVLISAIEIIRMKKDERKRSLSKVGLFVLSVGALVCVSSITIRVELRWMYFPYVAAVFLLIYLTSIKSNRWIFSLKLACLVVYVITMIGFGFYCRRYYTNLYYWPVYTAANSLSDCTYGEYEEKMYEKSWVIIASGDLENSYEDLMNQFDPYDQYDLQLQVVRSVDELQSIDNIKEKEVLYYVEKEMKFTNVSNMVYELYTQE